MSERLQVLFEEAELAEIRRAAKARRMTVAEWVRGALREARQARPAVSADRKLQVVRAAARHGFPTADIATMVAEIERGYLEEPES